MRSESERALTRDQRVSGGLCAAALSRKAAEFLRRRPGGNGPAPASSVVVCGAAVVQRWATGAAAAELGGKIERKMTKLSVEDSVIWGIWMSWSGFIL